jgi:hypothetical protein
LRLACRMSSKYHLFYESHNFVEFDDKELIEQGNFIISSEAEKTGFRE